MIRSTLNLRPGPCGGWVFERCFPGDVHAENPPETVVTWTAVTETELRAGGGLWYVAAALGLSASVGAAALAERRRRRIIEESERDAALDRLFAEDLFDELWGPAPADPPEEPDMPATPHPATALLTAPARRETEPSQPTGKVQTKRPARLGLGTRLMLLGGLLFSGFCLACGLTTPPQAHEVTRLVPVETEVRRTTRMDHIRRGDIVLARDEYGTEIGPRRVVQVFRRESDHLRHLTFRAEDGREQTIRTTDEHPIWVAGLEDYLEARFLEPGVEVVTPEGQRQTLVSTWREEHPEGIAVFNFEVEEAHTYYVSEDGLAAGILVHNRCAVLERRLNRLGYDRANTARILGAIERGEQVVIVGENMRRVNVVARMVERAGGRPVTYAPRNWSGLNRNSLEANRSWLRYWVREKGLTVIDIGRQPTPRPGGPSPFYGLENRSLIRWRIYTPFH